MEPFQVPTIISWYHFVITLAVNNYYLFITICELIVHRTSLPCNMLHLYWLLKHLHSKKNSKQVNKKIFYQKKLNVGMDNVSPIQRLQTR